MDCPYVVKLLGSNLTQWEENQPSLIVTELMKSDLEKWLGTPPSTTSIVNSDNITVQPANALRLSQSTTNIPLLQKLTIAKQAVNQFAPLFDIFGAGYWHEISPFL